MLQEKPDQQLDFHPPEEDEGLVVSEEDMEGPVEPPPVPHVGPPPVTYVSEIEADEFYVRGREITPIRNYPDGTQDIIYVRS
jgi:hypothetical protein